MKVVHLLSSPNLRIHQFSIRENFIQNHAIFRCFSREIVSISILDKVKKLRSPVQVTM